ncbi:hypothetical protein [Nostoc sphaeroides]|nr:hypothetical protein [Nostoc sphaeroides]
MELRLTQVVLPLLTALNLAPVLQDKEMRVKSALLAAIAYC